MTRLASAGEAIKVKLGEDKSPVFFAYHGHSYQVTAIAQRWRVDTDWWDVRLWRDYFKLTTNTGQVVIIYCDLITQKWFFQRLYD